MLIGCLFVYLWFPIIQIGIEDTQLTLPIISGKYRKKLWNQRQEKENIRLGTSWTAYSTDL